MKLHANRQARPEGHGSDLVRRVLEQGWSLTEAAEAAGVSVRTAGKWTRRYRAEGEAGLLDRSSAPRASTTSRPPERVEAIAALRRVRLTGPEIAEVLGMATSTVSAVLKRIGLGRLSPPGARGAGPPLRALPPWRADPHRRQEARPDRAPRRRAPGHRAAGGAQPDHGGRQGHAARARLGAGPRLRRRRHPPRLRRGPARREGDDRDRLPAAGARLLPLARDHGGAADDRQRLRLRLDRPRPRLPGARHPPHPHPALPAPDQRQGGALHPHDAAASGPTRPSTAAHRRGPRPSPVGSSATTTADDMAPSATGRRSLGCGSSRGTTWPASTARDESSRPFATDSEISPARLRPSSA